MRIATVAYYLPPNDRIGAGFQMHYLANAYAQCGHEVTMFSPYSEAEKAPDALYSMQPVPVGLKNRTFRFAWNLRKQNFKGFDLIHAGMDDYWLAGKKRPYHIRTFMGSCIAEAIYAKGLRAKVRMSLLGLSEVASCFIANRKVCISKDTLKYCPTVQEVVGCGLDHHLFRPGTVKSEAPSILFIGTMHERKRGAELLEIFQKEIRPRFPNAELWIVREPNPVAAEGVKWFGPVATEKLIELYQNAWVFCLPSSYEGFGVPYIEAMACGTPTVATPNPGALEVLENGKHGIIADLPELGKALTDLLDSPQKREEYREKGLKRAEDFHWDRIVSLYLSTVPVEGQTLPLS